MSIVMRKLPTVLLVAGALVAFPAAGAAELEPTEFARVGQTVITADEFSAALRDGVRRKYYHGKVPESEMPVFQREVGDKLIERALLLAEAGRLGVAADPAWVAPRLENFERRFSSHADWSKNRERILAAVRAQLEAENRIGILQARVRGAVQAPAEEALRAWYAAHPEKFTEPERFRVSAILLKVDPSSAGPVWEAAAAEAEAIVAKLRAGAGFSELARLHSGDGSAEKGGDMGYLHRGMLGGPAQKAIDAAELGKPTDPVRLLEGVAIFRVDERPVPRLRAFDEVRERARELWLREHQDQAWADLLQRLRGSVEVKVNTQHYLPLPG